MNKIIGGSPKYGKRSIKKIMEYVQKKIIFEICLYLTVGLIMLVIGIYNYINIIFTIIPLTIGLIIGLFFGNSSKVIWENEKNKIIEKRDLFSFILLIIYLLFVIFRKRILSFWFFGQELTILSIWLTFGVMLGKAFILRSKLRKVLRHNIENDNINI
jgi:hypothetical protein